MNRPATGWSQSMRVRLPVLALLVLAVSLGLSLALSYQLLRIVGERDLDQALAREYQRFARSVATTTADLRAAGTPVEVELVRRAINDFHRLNPGSDTYLTVIRIGGEVIPAPEPPAELADLARAVAFPAPTVVGYETLDSEAGPLRSLYSPIRLDGAGLGGVQVIGSTRPISETAAEFLGWLAILAGVSMLVGGAALTTALVRGLRPLRDLAGTAERTGELAHLSERVREPARADEVGILAREFNRMLERLEAAARARTEFLASVSHELRTPVTIARGHIETLERGGADDPEHVRATARVIREELTHVGRLVDDLLALDRAELDDFVVPVPLPLPRLFADLELRLGGLGLPDVELLPAPEITIPGDTARLQQALLNLAVNATVHTPPGTRVIVSAQQTGDGVALVVTDDGPGIDPEILDRVREPFVRRAPLGHDSSGLGLAVVEAVARAHGGRVEIASGLDGTVVAIVLPAGTGLQAKPNP